MVLKNCFQMPVDWEIDKGLVKDLVRAGPAKLDYSPSSVLDPRKARMGVEKRRVLDS